MKYTLTEIDPKKQYLLQVEDDLQKRVDDLRQIANAGMGIALCSFVLAAFAFWFMLVHP